MNSINAQPKKLFSVFSEGRKVEGEFGSKMAAKRFRDKHNAKLEKGERPWWVGPGVDHWRNQPVSNWTFPGMNQESMSDDSTKLAA